MTAIKELHLISDYLLQEVSDLPEPLQLSTLLGAVVKLCEQATPSLDVRDLAMDIYRAVEKSKRIGNE